MPSKFTRIPTLKSIEAFAEYVRSLPIDLQFESQLSTGDASALKRPWTWKGKPIGNRWAVHPMEGWDATAAGGVTDSMLRRWARFGESGAKLIWGGEAMSVRPDGRANPNQLIINEQNKTGIARLRESLLKAHGERHGRTDDLIIGFQLTHSGRFCRPNAQNRYEPRVAFRHPLLDKKFHVTSDEQIFSDDDLKRLADDYVAAAKMAAEIGADFVDIKHCHGYLLHELLAAHTRPGPYGGSLENRDANAHAEIVAGIRAAIPRLEIGVRLSAFDLVPFKPNPEAAEPGKLGPGMPEDFSIACPTVTVLVSTSNNPVQYDLAEPIQFLRLLETWASAW